MLSFAVLVIFGFSPVQAHAYLTLQEVGRTAEWECLSTIYAAEASWNPAAYGDSDRGGSYGLPQRHSKVHGVPPQPWPVRSQVLWTLDYADERYGGVCEGLAFRNANGWW